MDLGRLRPWGGDPKGAGRGMGSVGGAAPAATLGAVNSALNVQDPRLPLPDICLRALLLPLVLVVVPLGGEAVHRVGAHVQHTLDLLGLPLVGQGVRLRGEHCQGNGGRPSEEGSRKIISRSQGRFSCTG